MTSRVRVAVAGAAGVAFIEWLQPRLDDRFVFLPPRLDAGSESLAGVDVALCTRLTEAQLAGADSLRLVQLLGAGTDGIPFAAVPPSCAICNVYGHEGSVAEWVLMAILALTRGALHYDRHLRKGGWGGLNTQVTSVAPDLRKHTIGVVGAGPLGRRVIELTRPFFGRQVGITRNASPARQNDLGLDFLGTLDDVERVAQESNMLVLCIALSESTRDLIGEPELRALGPTSYLVNVSRGPVVREHDLFVAVRDGEIAGAAIDVWYRYPTATNPNVQPSSFPFFSLSNILMSPHCAGWTEATLEHRREFILAQLLRVADDEPLANQVRQAGGETDPTEHVAATELRERRRSHGDRYFARLCAP